jgi:hypothetical protein
MTKSPTPNAYSNLQLQTPLLPTPDSSTESVIPKPKKTDGTAHSQYDTSKQHLSFLLDLIARTLN